MDVVDEKEIIVVDHVAQVRVSRHELESTRNRCA